MKDRDVLSMSEDEMGEIWASIGGTPHLFNKEEFLNWMDNGVVPEGIELGALELMRVGDLIKSMKFTADSKGEWY